MSTTTDTVTVYSTSYTFNGVGNSQFNLKLAAEDGWTDEMVIALATALSGVTFPPGSWTGWAKTAAQSTQSNLDTSVTPNVFD